MDKTKKKIMRRILEKCGTLSALEKHIENYVKEFGEASREFFIATMWETVHAMNATATA